MLRYNLDALGWLQFEELCQSLLKTSYGNSVTSWGGRGDFGRDAYAECNLRISKGISASGPFVFQVKFVEGANGAGADPLPLLLKSIKAEFSRIKDRVRRLSWTQPNHYDLLTNVDLDGGMRKQIDQKITSTLKCKSLVWGGKDLCDKLDAAPALRLSFPQLLGIRDIKELLAEVLLKATVERSKAQLEKAAELARVFVPTSAYNSALNALRKHHFVVLTGPPETGKTAIALMICLAKASEEWQFYDCIEPKDFLEARNDGLKQVFLVDDAFGDINYRPDRAKPWGDQMERVLRRVDSKHWLIWTSRPAPLHEALQGMDLKDKAEDFPKLSEVFIDAAKISPEERAKILYRHAKAASLTEDVKAMVKKCALELIKNKSFTPERVKRFVSEALPAFVAKERLGLTIGVLQNFVKREIEEPTVRMRKSFSKLKPDEKILLLSLLDTPSGTALRQEAIDAFSRHARGVKTRSFDEIVEILSDHFIR